MLRLNGYSTAAFGKWHNTPAMETTAAGPFENWPTGLGFEYFYGFLAGEASQYEPNLVRNTTYVHPPKTVEEGYHLSEDLADDAMGWLRNHKAFQPDKPFFMYWAPGAVHAPHHVPKEWSDKYRGKFDAGWDVWREATFARQQQLGLLPEGTELSPRPEWVPAWDSLPGDEQRVAARFMECFAAFLSHADHHVGRVLDFLAEIGRLDDTLVFALSDNGASSELDFRQAESLLEGARVADFVDLCCPISLEVRQRHERDLVGACERLCACSLETIEIELCYILRLEYGIGGWGLDWRHPKQQPDGIAQRSLVVLCVVELQCIGAHFVVPRDRSLCRGRRVACEEKRGGYRGCC